MATEPVNNAVLKTYEYTAPLGLCEKICVPGVGAGGCEHDAPGGAFVFLLFYSALPVLLFVSFILTSSHSYIEHLVFHI